MQRKRLGKALEEASLDPNLAPAKLTAPLLDRMMRIWVMLSQVGWHSPYISPVKYC